MKQTANFPYKVVVNSGLSLELLEDEASSDSFFVYSLAVPENLFNSELLIKYKDNLKLVAEVNASSTLYREVFISSNLDKIIFKINKKNVFDSFSIDVIILFDTEQSFDDLIVKKGMPFAHLGSFKINIDSSSQSLISFISHEDLSNVIYSFGDHSIKIKIPVSRFEWLNKNRNNLLVKNILASQFAQIALLEACQKIKDTSNDHLLWQKELKRKWKIYSKDDRDVPNDDEIVTFVNYILENPSEKLLDCLVNYLDKDE